MSPIPLRLVRKNLTRHPVRTFLTLGSLVVAFFLLCTLRSLVVTLDAAVDEAKSNRLIVQSAVSLFVILPESYESKIRSVEGVDEICRWTWFGGYYQEPSNFFAQFAVSEESLFRVYPELALIEGDRETFFSDRRACILGVGLAEEFGWKVGDTVPIISVLFPRQDGSAWEFRLAAIYRSGTATVDDRTVFFHHEYLLKSIEDGGAEGPEGVGVYVVTVADGTAPEIVMGRIDALFENGPQRVQTTTEAEFQAQFVSMIGNVPFFVSSIGMGVFFAILLAVLNTMLMAARQQAHDVGILKALGFDRVTVFVVLLLQSVLLTSLGGVLGVGLALATQEGFARALGSMFPYYEVSSETALLGVGAALLLGLLAGAVPAAGSSRLSPVESLRVEA